MQIVDLIFLTNMLNGIFGRLLVDFVDHYSAQGERIVRGLRVIEFFVGAPAARVIYEYVVSQLLSSSVNQQQL